MVMSELLLKREESFRMDWRSSGTLFWLVRRVGGDGYCATAYLAHLVVAVD